MPFRALSAVVIECVVMRGRSVFPQHGIMVARHGAIGGVPGKVGDLIRVPQVRHSFVTDSSGRGSNGAVRAPSTLPKASAESDRTERLNEILCAPPLSSAKADDRVGSAIFTLLLGGKNYAFATVTTSASPAAPGTRQGNTPAPTIME